MTNTGSTPKTTQFNMANRKKHLCIDEVVMMYKGGIPKKKIAFIVGVTEKTVATWLKEYQELEQTTIGNIKALENKLNNLLKNPNTPTNEIKDIAYSIEVLEKRLKNS